MDRAKGGAKERTERKGKDDGKQNEAMNGRTGQRRKTNGREKNKRGEELQWKEWENGIGKNVNQRKKQLIMKIFAK